MCAVNAIADIFENRRCDLSPRIFATFGVVYHHNDGVFGIVRREKSSKGGLELFVIFFIVTSNSFV
jgi:hypothetical protein